MTSLFVRGGFDPAEGFKESRILAHIGECVVREAIDGATLVPPALIDFKDSRGDARIRFKPGRDPSLRAHHLNGLAGCHSLPFGGVRVNRRHRRVMAKGENAASAGNGRGGGSGGGV